MTFAAGPFAGAPFAAEEEVAGGTTHTASGALASQAATVSGAAAHHALHSASGALASQASSVSGSAAHTAPGSFSATGALASQAASIAGAAIRRAKHSASGALAAGAASITGSAAHTGPGATEDVSGRRVRRYRTRIRPVQDDEPPQQEQQATPEPKGKPPSLIPDANTLIVEQAGKARRLAKTSEAKRRIAVEMDDERALTEALMAWF